MGTLTINGKKVQVDDSFAQLSPQEQEATVNEIAAQIGGAPQQASPAQPAMPGVPAGVPLPFQDQIAFGDQAIDSVPVIGPWLKEQAQNLRGAIGGAFGIDKAKLDAYSQQSVQNAPVASMAGQAFGTVAPLAGAGLLPGVGRLLGTTGNALSRTLLGGASGGAISAADTAARGGDPGDIGLAGAVGVGLGAGIPLVGGLAGRLLRGGVSREAKNLGRAMTDDNIDPTTINQQLQDMGDGAMVMDLGPNLQAQAGALASVPGKAQKTLRAAIEARAKAASGRVQNDLAATVGTGPELSQMTEQIITAQKAASKPLYDAVRDEVVEVTGNLKFVFQTPMGKEALQKAMTIAKNDGYGFQSPTVGLMDYAKQALDDIVSTAKRTGENNRVRQATDLLRILRKEVDAQVPGYAKARAAFAGPAQVLDAIEFGQTLLSKDISPGQLQSRLSTMTASEKDGLLQSFRASLEAQLGTAVNDALSLRNALKKGWNEQKIRLLLGDEVADDLMRRVSREAAFGNTSGVVARNSETARRTASQEEIAPDLKRLEPAGGLALLFRAINDARAKLMGSVYAKSNQKLAGALTATGIDPKLMQQTARAMKGKGRAVIPPAAVPMLPVPSDNRRKPIDITVYGGAT